MDVEKIVDSATANELTELVEHALECMTADDIADAVVDSIVNQDQARKMIKKILDTWM